MFSKARSSGGEETVVEGVRFKNASVKMLENEKTYTVVVRLYFLRKFPYFARKFSFDNAREAEAKYDFLKNYYRRFA